MKKQESGFSLVELIVSLLVLSVLLAYAIPSYQRVTASNALRSTVADMITTLKMAKMQSVSLRQQVSVTPETGTDWQTGWVLDFPGGSVEKDQTFLPAGDVVVTQTLGSAGPVFKPDGFTSNTPVAFRLCNAKAGDSGRLVSVSVVGRVSSEDVSCSP